MIIDKDLAIEDGNITAQDRQRWEKGFHCCSCTHGSLVDSEWKCNHGSDIRKDCLSYFHPPLHKEKYPKVEPFLNDEEMSI